MPAYTRDKYISSVGYLAARSKKEIMEICSKCNRRVSLPFYVIRDGKLNVLCFSCACNSAGLSVDEAAVFSHAPFVAM